MGEDLIMDGVNNQVLLTGLVGLVTTIISGWASWLLSKRKYNSEVDSNVIKNMQDSLEFYKQLSDDNKSRLEEVLKRNDQLQDEVSQLRSQVMELMNSLCYNMSCELRMRSPKAVVKKTSKPNCDAAK